MKIVAYYRVSTKKQGESGLGLAAQKEAIARYARANHGEIVAQYKEVETGKRDDRPKLIDAIGRARLAKATLVIAKIDRLARKHSFVATLMDSGVDFIACDNPHANRLTIHILSAVAEDEAIKIGERTKVALAAAKAKGKKLGSARPGHWDGRAHLRGWRQAAEASAESRSRRAKEAYQFLEEPIADKLRDGWSYQAISDWLSIEGHVTTAGKPFTPTAVWRIVQRTPKLAGIQPKTEVEYRRPQKRIATARSEGMDFPQIAKILAKEGHTLPNGYKFTAADVARLAT